MAEEKETVDTNVSPTGVKDDDGAMPNSDVESVSQMEDYGDFTEGFGEDNFDGYAMDEDESGKSFDATEDDYDYTKVTEEEIENDSSNEGDDVQEEKEQEKQTTEQKPLSKEEEARRFFQSNYDKLLRQNEILYNQLQQFQAQGQIGQRSDQKTGEQDELKEPEPPIMPDDFDIYEARNDPKSSSAEYLRKNEQYQKDLIQYNTKKAIQDYDAERRKEEKAYQEQIEYEQMKQQINTHLVSTGLPQESIDDFGKWLNSSESIKPIVGLYKHIKGIGKKTKISNTTQLHRNKNAPRVDMNINNQNEPETVQQGFNRGRKAFVEDDY